MSVGVCVRLCECETVQTHAIVFETSTGRQRGLGALCVDRSTCGFIRQILGLISFSQAIKVSSRCWISANKDLHSLYKVN